jgi:hypothetical protein
MTRLFNDPARSSCRNPLRHQKRPWRGGQSLSPDGVRSGFRQHENVAKGALNANSARSVLSSSSALGSVQKPYAEAEISRPLSLGSK